MDCCNRLLVGVGTRGFHSTLEIPETVAQQLRSICNRAERSLHGIQDIAIAKYALVGRAFTDGESGSLRTLHRKKAMYFEYRGALSPGQRNTPETANFLFVVNRRKTIDGLGEKLISRVISIHSCQPNCESKYGGVRRLCRGKRRIKPGEELFYDTDTEYFNAHILGHKRRAGAPRATVKRGIGQRQLPPSPSSI